MRKNALKIAVRACLSLILCLAISPPPAGAARSGRQDKAPARLGYVATIQPLAEIIKKIVGARGRVGRLLPPGSSPHTFAPKPSAVKETEQAAALFFVGPGLDKEWINRLPAPRKIEVLALLPAEFRLPATVPHTHARDDHDEKAGQKAVAVDPHFWTDPLAVRALLPELTAVLAGLDPPGRATYEANSAAFAAELGELDRELATILEPAQKMPLIMFHPSFQYLVKRYRLNFAGVITPFPGWEPSPRALLELREKIRQTGARAIFSETQLGRRPAVNLAEAASTAAVPIKVYELDPLGGRPGRESYTQLLRYNAAVLRAAALQQQPEK